MTPPKEIPIPEEKSAGEKFVEWAVKHIRLKDVYDQFDFPNDATDFNTMRQYIVNKINKIISERDRYLHTQSVNGLSWIELKEGCEMPGIDEPVLWLQEDGIFFVREIDKDDHSWWKGDENADALFGGAPKCTHWARIPLPDESPAPTPSVGGIKWVEASERLPDKPANLQRLFVDWKGSFNIWVYFAEQGFWVWFTTFRRVSDSEMTEVLWLDIFGIPIGENEAERIHANARIADLEKLLEEKQECINNQKYIDNNMDVLKKEAKK